MGRLLQLQLLREGRLPVLLRLLDLHLRVLANPRRHLGRGLGVGLTLGLGLGLGLGVGAPYISLDLPHISRAPRPPARAPPAQAPPGRAQA